MKCENILIDGTLDHKFSFSHHHVMTWKIKRFLIYTWQFISVKMQKSSSCFATNHRNKHFLQSLFTALVVTGGIPTYHSVEILHKNGTFWCTLEDFPVSRAYHTQTGMVTCGGEVSVRGKTERKNVF